MEMELSTPPTLHEQIRNCFLQISNDLDNLTDRQLEQIHDCIKKIFFDKVFDENKELIQQTKELKRQIDKCLKQKTHIEERYHKRSRQLDECISEKNQIREEFNKGKAQYDQISKDFHLLSERFNKGKEQFDQLISEKEELKRELKLEKDMLRENISENKDLKRQLHECSQLLNKCRDELNNQNSPPRAYSRPKSPPRAYSRPKSPPRAYSRPKSPPRAYYRPESPPRASSKPESPPRASSKPESPPRSRPNPQSIELNQEKINELTNCPHFSDHYRDYNNFKKHFTHRISTNLNKERLNKMLVELLLSLSKLRDELLEDCIDKSGLKGEDLYMNYREWFREEYKNIKSLVDNYNSNKELKLQLKFFISKDNKDNKDDEEFDVRPETIYGGIPKMKNNKTKKQKKQKNTEMKNETTL